MAIFKCKMCGGSLEVTEGMTVCECEYCGTQQTLPKTDNEQNLNLFNRANHFRQLCEFDKAAEIYERMAGSSEGDAELYWSLVLCRYGIEYVDDPLTKKKIATCHRTQYKSILDDPDYQTALEHADMSQRSVYEREAAYIDKIQKGILEISNKEQPFDVFICYKETDENGRRTPDSVLAQELYYGLTQEGFKVFFSRITLESKLGTEYEPYIFAALNSAKVMVVVGTKPEYFNAVWVRNEWSRYLMLMQEDRSRTLIPAYKDMDPYDLPDALSMFQAQDMSKLGFLQDLIRGIKKIVKSEPEQPVVQQTVIQQAAPASANVENLLKRGNLALETGKWQDASDFFEQVLNENVEEHRAYIGKLCAEYQVESEEKIATLQKDFTDSENYRMACRFGGAEVKKRLFSYRQQSLYDAAMQSMQVAKSSADYRNAEKQFSALNGFKDAVQKSEECEEQAKSAQEREEHERKIGVFQSAERLMQHGNTEEDMHTAIRRLEGLTDYPGVEELIEKCHAKIEEIREQQRKREESARKMVEQEEKKKKRRKLLVVIAIAVVIVIIIGTIVVVNVQKANLYKEAVSAYESGDYTTAEEKFNILGEYKDSAEYLSKPQLAKAGDIVEFGKYTWYVIDKTANGATLLCENVVEEKNYNDRIMGMIHSTTWEDCTLRSWLNDEFYNEFTDEEKAMIAETNCSNADNSTYGTDGGNDTADYVYLLSEEEAGKLDITILDCETRWWMRTPGNDQEYAVIVTDGDIKCYGSLVDSKEGVRPAITLCFNKN